MKKYGVVIAFAAVVLTFAGFPDTSFGQAAKEQTAVHDDPSSMTDGEMHRYGMNRYSPNDGGRTDTDGYGVNNYRAYAANERGPGWGWLGLLGLFGLAGLFGRSGGRGRA